jgi:hypothetical protein
LLGSSGLTFSGKGIQKVSLQRPEGRDFPAVSVVSGRDFPAVAFLASVILKMVLVSTAGFSVLNTGIFWRETETKRLLSQCSDNGKIVQCWWPAGLPHNQGLFSVGDL